jgi:DNA-directed RNA polymerase subunit A'
MEIASKRLESVTFGLLSPDVIKKTSVAKIVTPELYDIEGYPVDGGLMDIRLGVIDPGLRCKTCGGKLKECMGHFGFMDLARPVINIGFVDVVLNLLKVTCKECGRIFADDKKIVKHKAKIDALKKEGRVRDLKKANSTFITSLRNLKSCPHCEAKNEPIKLEKPYTFFEGTKRLTPIEIRSRLEKMSDEDLALLGINAAASRPEWMIITIFLVPPVTVRPSITLESGERSEDDLTHKLSDIVRINQRLFENINAGAPEIIIEDLWDLLQYHITTFFDNSVVQLPVARHRSGQPLKTLTDRIKSKEGRFRHNLAGKRVNYSARTVISPDPKIKFNEVGIPESVAIELTVPERVTEWNKEWLKELIKKGPENYPGANYVIRPDGKKKRITDETKEVLLDELDIGFVVERHLVDGDVSLFNRQPSLHRMSIMCHKIRVLPGRSFRLNPAVCTPYNADFDGDEMNLHIPQTEESRAEAEMLMSVQNHIISPKNGLNIIGSIEDSVTGMYLLTNDLKLSKSSAISLLMSAGVNDLDKMASFGDVVSGRDIFSVILPQDIEYLGESRNKEDVVIKNGKLLKGTIDRSSIGEEKGGLIRKIYAKYGEEVGIEFLSKVFRLGIASLLELGFTISISDTDIPDATRKKNEELIKNAKEKVYKFIDEYNAGKLEALPGNTEEETLELRISEVLNKVRDKVGEHVVSVIDETNNAVIMANSGAKGNLLNLAMMSSVVGQQAIGGKRIVGGFSGRVLSSFKKGDLSPSAKGFVDKGYKQGMSPQEYFFSAMTGRDALMDTALRTPKSGYLYRRLSNALQDIRIEYDYTVRDARKKIIQFKYSEDGMDVSKSDGGTIDVKRLVKEVKGK